MPSIVAKSALEPLVDYLHQEGYRPEFDPEFGISFKREGGSYVIMMEDNDVEYIRLIYPYFYPWDTKDHEERFRVLSACDVANASTKVAKVYTFEGDVWANIEMFLSDPAGLQLVFERSVAAIATAVQTFLESMASSSDELEEQEDTEG